MAKRRYFSPRSLGTRQALQVGVVAIGALMVSGAIEMAYSYREAIGQAQALQAAQAAAAARELDSHLSGLMRALRDTTKMPWGADGYPPKRLRDDLARLLVLHDSITDLVIVRASGQELLRLSRTQPDTWLPEGWPAALPRQQALRPSPARLEAPYLREGGQSSVDVVLSEILDGQASLRATVSFRVVADILARAGRALDANVYLLDDADWLIAHPVQTEILLRRHLGQASFVGNARRSLSTGLTGTWTEQVRSTEGQALLATATLVPQAGWLLVLEQPVALVLDPVFATMWRTALLVTLATVFTAVVSIWSGRRMARPLLALRAGGARIAGGDFKTPVVVDTGDELELLAHDLNRMADRLSRFYESLEEEVALRTQQLQQARDAAERANQSKTRFLAAASHDLRQPMHTIGLLVGLLGHELREQHQLVLAGKLKESVGSMERLFSSLLDISKLDSGAVQPSWEIFPVQDLLDRIALRFEVEAGARGLQLRVHRCAAIVQSDPGLLERCLGNLVANALTYTETGRVVVGCRRRHDSLAIQGHDTGPGIAAEHLKLIFEEFVRLPGSASSKAGGLGLGLAIVHRTTALLGHALSVKSVLGSGSMFEVSLAQLPAVGLPPTRATMAHRVGTELLGTFVLVVDDDDGNRVALQELCTRWGCHVAAASSAEAALEELERHLRSPDLVLTDLQLGGPMDGLDLVAHMRLEAEERIPCVLVTADTAAAVLERARIAAVEVLHKPAAEDRLYAAACGAVGRRTRRAEGAGFNA